LPREMEPSASLSPPGSLDLGRGLTYDADADSRAFPRPVTGVSGHTAVGPLILRPYLRKE
jgi:hypothetical protein